MPAREEYGNRLNTRQASLRACERRHQTLGYFRLLLILSAIAIAVAAVSYEALSPWWLLACAAVFWLLGARMQRVEDQRSQLARAVAFYERALARLNGRWAGTGETGERFLDDDHLYAADLDIFGNASLYQLLCAARTRIGEEMLAAWLRETAPAETVRMRQEAVLELAPKLDLREDLALVAETARTGLHAETLAAWGEREPLLRSSPFRAVAWVLSVAGAIAIVALITYAAAMAGLLVLTDRTSTALRLYFLGAALVIVLVLRHFKKRTNRILEEAEEASHDLALLAGVLRRLEAEQFTSPRVATLRAELDVEGRPPSRRIRQLNLLADLVDSRHNEFVRILGPLLLWDLHLCYALESWRNTSGRAMRRWLNAVGEMEALSSLAGYYYEHPHDCFPELLDGQPIGTPCFDGEALAHPLLPEDRVVSNDVRLGCDGARVLVVSGSNMSGKSTLLRTVGINAVLAQAGAPVRARSFRLSPLAVGASIRIQDSLQAGESRFYAEITRLRKIMDRAASAPPVLFLIDEILHGTNSHDRRIGGEAIVRGLVERGAIGLITTHDLALADIVDPLAPRAVNVHFEDHLEDGRMRFDYKMRPGVVRKSNAIELMRSVGLDV